MIKNPINHAALMDGKCKKKKKKKLGIDLQNGICSWRTRANLC